MDLKSLIEWAKKYDVTKVPQEKNQRSKVSTYLGMIIDKGGLIVRNSNQSDGYMNDIKEYLGHLDKMGVAPIQKPEQKI